MQIILTIILIILAAAIAGVGVYLFLKPRLVATQEQDLETLKENEKLKEQYKLLCNQNLELENNKNKLNAEKESIISNIEILNQSMQTTKDQAELAAKQFYDLEMELAQTKLNQDIINATQVTKENIESFQIQVFLLIKLMCFQKNS